MGHGKETPRQKMIGMMYLVLTAMLALNVSADLLNAFVLVDGGLSQTTRNYANKNATTFNKFEQAELLNPQKVGPWKAKAEEIHKQSQAIYKFVKELKYRVVETADGSDSPALLENGEVDGGQVSLKTNTDVPAQVLILEGNGAKLKEMLAKYRTTIQGMLNPDKDKELYDAVSLMLDTKDPDPGADGQVYTWESYRFEHIPLIATLPQLTKVQVDVLNAEADITGFLLGKIDAGAFKFNKINAVVIPRSDFVMRGSEFTAEIFLAASDTTQKPVVYIGQYDSTLNERTGEWSYEMKGHYDTVPVSESGRGMLRRVCGTNGSISWGGLIEIKGPEGGVIRKPFKHRYTVSEPSFAVSATKMNVLYLGVDNPIEVSVSGVSKDRIAVTMTGGTLRPSGQGYIAKPSGRPNSTCKISVAAKDGGATKSMGSKTFRIKAVPDPIPTIFGVDPKATSIRKGELSSAQGVVAQMPDDFDFDMKFQVLGFTVGTTIGQYLTEQTSSSMKFTNEQKQLIKNLTIGSQMTITNIKVKGPDGVTRTLQSKVYKIK